MNRWELSVSNARAYLAGRGVSAAAVRELGGGVSNTVLHVETAAGERWVLKQALGKLRVEMDWRSDPRRVLREAVALELLSHRLPAGSVPGVVFVDEPNLLFAMEAAPAGAPTWKDELLAGRLDEEAARRVGRLLAALAAVSWRSQAIESQFGDQTVFAELRIDPYYRTTREKHPLLAPYFDDAISSMAGRRLCLVHGDWSPKNFLMTGAGPCAIDFEVIHFGDPAFDLAFVLNHLLLKTFHLDGREADFARLAQALWDEYRAGFPEPGDWLIPATVLHLGCLLLARIDGKSPAEYIRAPAVKDRIRRFAGVLLADPPATIGGVWERVIRP